MRQLCNFGCQTYILLNKNLCVMNKIGIWHYSCFINVHVSHTNAHTCYLIEFNYFYYFTDLDEEKNMNYPMNTLEWLPPPPPPTPAPMPTVYTIQTDKQVLNEKTPYEITNGCENHCAIGIKSNNNNSSEIKYNNNNCVITNSITTKSR